MRDSSIDILRSIGIIVIIVAHTIGNVFVLQLRNFDVPLMVFLSGFCYSGIKHGYLVYVYKRFIRLIIPTWIFLCLYFPIAFLLGEDISTRLVFNYFTLQTVWYVWIIRVFFSIALLAPIIIWCGKNCGRTGFFVVGISFLIALTFLANLSGNQFYQYVLISAGYCVFFYFGHLAKDASRRTLTIISVCSGIIFLTIAAYFLFTTHTFVPTSEYKYPPQLYYGAYASCCICILFIFRHHISKLLSLLKVSKLFIFIGSHTLWLYFYHVLILTFLGKVEMWGGFRFLVVFFGALVLTWLHTLLFKLIPNKTVQTVFIG